MCPFLPGLPKSLSKALHDWALQSPNHTSSFPSHLSLLTDSYSAFKAQLWHQHPTGPPLWPWPRPEASLWPTVLWARLPRHDPEVIRETWHVLFAFPIFTPSQRLPSSSCSTNGLTHHRCSLRWGFWTDCKIKHSFSSPSTPDLQFPDLQ